MSEKTLKALTGVFWTSVAAVVVAFGMGIFTAVSKHQAEKAAEPAVIFTPAAVPAGGAAAPAAPGVPVPAR